MPTENMPWYSPHLDADLKAALEDDKIQGGSFLDIGTGPGTQAIELTKLGFSVTATDLSKAAIEKARALSQQVTWYEDDILKTKLTATFDYIFDRGCFHVIAPNDRKVYVANLKKLIKPHGRVFIKCFSTEQPDAGCGPWRFSSADIQAIFGRDFELARIKDAVYQGTLEQLPKTLFVVLKPK